MLAAGLEACDVAWQAKCREEDMKQRALENERHAISDARRSVDEKAQQLQVMANQSALFAGFSMIGVFAWHLVLFLRRADIQRSSLRRHESAC